MRGKARGRLSRGQADKMKTAIRRKVEGVRERGTEGDSFSKMRGVLSCDFYSLKDAALVTPLCAPTLTCGIPLKWLHV